MKSSKTKTGQKQCQISNMNTTLRIFTLGKHRLHKEIKFDTKGSWQTEMNISHSNNNVIFFN